MSQSQAKRIATGVFIVTAAVVAWSEIAKKGSPLPSGKTLIALLVLGAGLAVGAEIAPSLFGPLALLFGLAVVVSRIPQGNSKFLSKFPASGSEAKAKLIRPNPIPGRGD
jgi:hypothetical protein